ncbi:MAG: hypothetical protein GXP25_18280 [Planctomycetes bacterium]|nr:hypothetical protein [Planctomycetota bacterium]
MKAGWATRVLAGLVVLSMASVALAARFNYDTPRGTYNAWVILMQQYEGKTEFIKRVYSQGLRAQIEERSKSPEGSRMIDNSHIYYNREIMKYEPSDTEDISDTEARIWLVKKDGSGEKAEIRFVLENDGWKIDSFPDIGSERGLGAAKLAILAVILFVIIIVLAKKVLLT